MMENMEIIKFGSAMFSDEPSWKILEMWLSRYRISQIQWFIIIFPFDSAISWVLGKPKRPNMESNIETFTNSRDKFLN